MSDSAFATLQATALTARCHNPYFRQKQLKSLHDVLRRNATAIRDAVKQDSSTSDADASTEVALALNVVKDHYATIDPEQALKDEYRIANNQDAGDAREPWGVVYIEPLQSHTPFFSAMSALSAALAAGNCVALKLENNLRALPSLLRTLLPEALESDTFGIVPSTPSTVQLSQCLQVLQETQITEPTYTQLASPQRKVLAIVDRTADLAAAASELVTARFAFGGTSPHGPDIILVNEFVRKEFIQHSLKYAIRFMAATESTTSSKISGNTKSSPVASTLSSLSASKSWNLSTITRGDSSAIVELSALSQLPPKISQPLLCIASITSLEHAISLIEAENNKLLVAYHFGTPQAGKYLAQFVPSDASFINHVPFSLLLGPAAPASHPIICISRYSVEMFSRLTPAYITPPAAQAALSSALSDENGRKASAELLGTATMEIKEKKRQESIAIGYFEQGIFIGLGVYGIPILTCLGATVFFGVRAGLRRWVFA